MPYMYMAVGSSCPIIYALTATRSTVLIGLVATVRGRLTFGRAEPQPALLFT